MVLDYSLFITPMFIPPSILGMMVSIPPIKITWVLGDGKNPIGFWTLEMWLEAAASPGVDSSSSWQRRGWRQGWWMVMRWTDDVLLHGSIRWSIRWSTRWSTRWSIRWSICCNSSSVVHRYGWSMICDSIWWYMIWIYIYISYSW